jgi:hypothetical protein
MFVAGVARWCAVVVVVVVVVDVVRNAAVHRTCGPQAHTTHTTASAS